MKNMRHIGVLVAAILLAPIMGIIRAFAPQGRDALNVKGTHEDGLVTRISEEAIGTANLLVTKGTADRQVLISSATTRPLGTAYDAVAITTDVGVALLGNGQTQLMVANGAITVDAEVYSAASGKVSATPTSGCWLVGHALTAASGDGKELEVQTCEPVLMGVPVSVSATGGTITALQALRHIHVSNAGASAAATFALPAALVGMRVTAIVEVAQELRLDPNGTETVALPSTGAQSAAGAYIMADAVGEKVQLVCLTAGTWDVVDYSGTWSAV